ncbi:hypothetical protein LWI29_029851 [Acer saccharum]|uniref:Uncharacterized protein n=1 Tax=Acer saccharum TaxID=4024 RepID=A0AA39RKE7_ACESA|nr:hypothetical protein LWI29_029851 [Acer saccharum]
MSSHSLSKSPSPSPPVAKKVEHVLEMFGDVRVDNYYWHATTLAPTLRSSPTSTSKTTTPTPSCLELRNLRMSCLVRLKGE